MQIGYAYVVGDVIHKGHLNHLTNCKGLCDKLIVGILTENACMERKPKPIMSTEERMDIVEMLKPVDVVVRQEEYSPLPNVMQLKPDILFESTSHKKQDFINGENTVNRYGGKMIIMPYYAGQSSTAVKNKILKMWKHKKEETFK